MSSVQRSSTAGAEAGRSVVITGRGAVSPLGDRPQDLYAALCAGQSGLHPVEQFSVENLPCRLAGEVRGLDPRIYFGRKNLRPLDRTARLATVTAHLALLDSGWLKPAGEAPATPSEGATLELLSLDPESGTELGLVLGTVFGSIKTIAEFDRRALEAGPVYAKPLDFANSVINAAAGQTAIWLGLLGINSTLSCGTASGLQAVGYAAHQIATGRADALLAGGAEELCFESFFGYGRTGRLATSEAAGAAVPFDERRGGFLLGEGAALLMLEEEERARGRGARILGRIHGFRSGFDPSRGTDDDAAAGALERVTRHVLEDTETSPEALSAWSASASGSPEGDFREASALAAVLGDRAPELPVTAVKSMLGESLGASGAFQALALLESLRGGRLPGVPGFVDGGPSFPLTISPENRQIPAGRGIVTALSFDGNVGALVLEAASNDSEVLPAGR